ncbi:MAG: head GIN domain-containing protein [Bacteroidota bacterium]
MIKFIVLCTKVILAAVIALLMTSCKYDIDLGNGIDGSGKVITEKRTINESFTKIETSRGIEVILDQANDVSVEVEADDNIIKHITTKVENGVLVVSTDESIDFAESMKVKVKMPTVNGLEATSGSSIKTNSTLKGNNLAVKTSSGSEIEATLEYESVTTESTSGSELTLVGKALKLSTKSSSGSDVEAGSLVANEITSEATSGSSTTVHPLVSLNAKASSGSSVNYNGTPKTVSEEETSGGDVSKN